MIKIIHNRIKCNKCGQEIESHYRHDYRRCRCKAVAVDGGKDYLKRTGEDYTDLTESIHIKDDIMQYFKEEDIHINECRVVELLQYLDAKGWYIHG